MMANESERSKVILIDPNAKTENFKRSSHNDFATSAELKQRKFSGWRMNGITGNAELWIEGNLDMQVLGSEIMRNPTAVEEAHAKRFGLI